MNKNILLELLEYARARRGRLLLIVALLFFSPTAGAVGLKITERPVATTPLAGTEIVGIIQNGEDKQTTSSELGGGSAQGLGPNFALTGGELITGVTEAKPLKIRGSGAQSANGWNIYQHSNGTPTIKCVTAEVEGDCDVTVALNTGKKFIIKHNGSTVLTIDPNAAGNLKYVWASGFRPIKTLPLTADAFYMQGAAALVTSSALVSGGLISPYITVTDSNSDGFHRYVVMDPKWDGGTVTATVSVVNTNATPANNFEVDVSGTCYPAGTVVATTISTTGEQPANVEFDAAGACGGSACSQNDPASASTAAITINGTPAGGNLCGFQAQVDATATTETVAGLKITQLDIHYGLANGF